MAQVPLEPPPAGRWPIEHLAAAANKLMNAHDLLDHHGMLSGKMNALFAQLFSEIDQSMTEMSDANRNGV